MYICFQNPKLSRYHLKHSYIYITYTYIQHAPRYRTYSFKKIDFPLENLDFKAINYVKFVISIASHFIYDIDMITYHIGAYLMELLHITSLRKSFFENKNVCAPRD